MRPALALLLLPLHLLPVSAGRMVTVEKFRLDGFEWDEADAAGNVLERNDYYPYGGLFGETGDVQPLKYLFSIIPSS